MQRDFQIPIVRLVNVPSHLTDAEFVAEQGQVLMTIEPNEEVTSVIHPTLTACAHFFCGNELLKVLL